jgi:flagellar hook-associated protein 1
VTVSSYMGLQTALSGLEADQEALNTVSQNIANANTPGYTRERVDLTTAPPLTIAAGSSVTGRGVQIGGGVDATSITRVTDQYLTAQYRTQNGAASGAATEASGLGQAQSLLNEPSNSGIASQLQAFWSSWSSLANDPSNQGARQAVIQSGTSLAESLNSFEAALSALQTQLASQYTGLTGASGPVQSDANQIASLNQKIAELQGSGVSPNTLMDQRDKLIDDLSSYANVTVTGQGNGIVSVSFGDAAQPLVNGTTVTWPQTLTSAAGGQLGALLDLSSPGRQIAGYLTALDGIANQLATSVNSLSTTTPFFSGNTAATIAVSATATTLQTGSTANPGDNSVALTIAGLSGGAADQAYSGFVTQVGGDVRDAQGSQATQRAVLTQISNQRQSVSGVSLDEEMSNLITYQQAYQASARVLTTMDSTLDTLINHTGMVGL